MAVWEGEGGRTVKTDLNRDAINIKAAMELAVADLADKLGSPGVTGVGHRIVHGGQQFKGPALLDESTMKQLRALVPFAPMHQPRNIEIIDAARAALPSATQFGCFDTAFHHGRPHLAKLYGLPCALNSVGDHVIWVSRNFLRLHRVAAEIQIREEGRWPGNRGTSWQWSQSLRYE